MEQHFYYPVGTIINFGNKQYKVVEARQCDDCAFWNKNKEVCIAAGEPRKWYCSRFAREDFKDVSFHLIEENCND